MRVFSAELRMKDFEWGVGRRVAVFPRLTELLSLVLKWSILNYIINSRNFIDKTFF